MRCEHLCSSRYVCVSLVWCGVCVVRTGSPRFAINPVNERGALATVCRGFAGVGGGPPPAGLAGGGAGPAALPVPPARGVCGPGFCARGGAVARVADGDADRGLAHNSKSNSGFPVLLTST